MAKRKPVSRPSTLLTDAWYAGGLTRPEIAVLIDEAKRYERRAKRRVSLAGGGDPARV